MAMSGGVPVVWSTGDLSYMVYYQLTYHIFPVHISDGSVVCSLVISVIMVNKIK